MTKCPVENRPAGSPDSARFKRVIAEGDLPSGAEAEALARLCKALTLACLFRQRPGRIARNFSEAMLRRPSSKKFDRLVGLNQEWTPTGRHQPRFAFPEGLMSPRLPRDFAGAAEKDQQVKATRLGSIP